ncbi:MAG: leucine-rich repeat domain-containing protein [Clostridia bacterium]|nr:leucine-rich repeat domain-containing protein [Clostridia bacterium]
MKNKHPGKLKIVLAFGILFLLVSVLLMLIFLDSKKTYTVEFELNGGTLLGGSLEQRVMQGQDAIPPSVVKDGAYLRGWSSSYKRVTKNLVIEAVWEYETTPGIIYADSENQNFTEIVGSFPHLRGEIYLGAYYNEKKILGIRDNVFNNQTEITKVYLLEGLLSIGNGAFASCTSLKEIEIPETIMYLGRDAFRDCSSLETLILHNGLLTIDASAFEGCTSLTEVVLPEGLSTIKEGAFADCTSLTEVIIPASLTTIAEGAFKGCNENLIIKIPFSQEEWPEGWADDWFGNAQLEVIEPEEDENDEDTDENNQNTEDADEEGIGRD